jgi:DNA invertase Pin-like site-specific DNA recombinase
VQRNEKRAILYARVSSKEQDREGFSIDAQVKLLRSYAEVNGVRIAREYVDIETAKTTGRTQFNEMISYLRSHPSVDTVLVEKTDRLYRNLRDWVTIDDLDLEIHFAKENVVLSPESRSSEKFMHGIKVLMAKNYIDNLSEETRKGMLEKAEQGIWPTVAPLGYRNVMGTNGKRVIEVDPETAPFVVKLFEWFSTGMYSLKQVGNRIRAEGMAYRKSHKPVGTSSVHKILRSRIYTGEFDWLGKRYQGSHEALISIELWERVQGVLDGRHTARIRGVERDFLFTGMIKCGHCGCMLVGDIEKKKYIYYRCSHYKKKCREPYVREEVLIEQFTAMLERITMTEPMYRWVINALRENFLDVKRDHDEAVARLQSERERLRERMKQIYLDNMDDKIEDSIFRALTAQFRKQERKIARELELRLDADLTYMDEGMRSCPSPRMPSSGSWRPS